MLWQTIECKVKGTKIKNHLQLQVVYTLFICCVLFN